MYSSIKSRAYSAVPIFSFTAFKSTSFSYTTITERMQESAFLLSGITIEVVDAEDGKNVKYHYENGLINFVEYINEGKNVLHKVINFNGIKQGIEVDIALQYQEGYNENILSFVNSKLGNEVDL